MSFKWICHDCGVGQGETYAVDAIAEIARHECKPKAPLPVQTLRQGLGFHDTMVLTVDEPWAGLDGSWRVCIEAASPSSAVVRADWYPA